MILSNIQQMHFSPVWQEFNLAASLLKRTGDTEAAPWSFFSMLNPIWLITSISRKFSFLNFVPYKALQALAPFKHAMLGGSQEERPGDQRP